MKKALLLANGDPPKISQIKYLQKKEFNFIICADGGANSAKKINIIPNVIIGDLDSIAKDTEKYYSDKLEIISISRQNDTDVEKALKYLIRKKYDEVVFLGATGDRLDHSICNLGIVIKFFNKIKISILHEKSFLKAYDKNVELKTQKDEIISIYGFDTRTKISSNGLKYSLKNVSLPFGQKESTSNVANGEKVQLKIKGGIIFVIRDFNTLQANDLI
ncbi:MAG: thiamine diphosphokinase [Melioribacteraceae bacterium]|nr:thiamine diphosphokinase [Melioribacteraceae bacterium]